jgi:hypothetical protein
MPREPTCNKRRAACCKIWQQEHENNVPPGVAPNHRHQTTASCLLRLYSSVNCTLSCISKCYKPTHRCTQKLKLAYVCRVPGRVYCAPDPMIASGPSTWLLARLGRTKHRSCTCNDMTIWTGPESRVIVCVVEEKYWERG